MSVIINDNFVKSFINGEEIENLFPSAKAFAVLKGTGFTSSS